jgi:hypothetical protein
MLKKEREVSLVAQAGLWRQASPAPLSFAGGLCPSAKGRPPKVHRRRRGAKPGALRPSASFAGETTEGEPKLATEGVSAKLPCL